MSGICGVVGASAAECVERMLRAIDYRGDSSDSASTPHAALGYRFWRGRPNKSSAVLREGATLVCCAGTLAPAVASPAHWFEQHLRRGSGDWSELDGAFAFAHWHEADQKLTLGRDPFGVRSLYYVEHAGSFYFASELKQLLALAALPVEVDHAALHKYLTFSFVPGEDTPVRGVRRLLPGHIALWYGGRMKTRP